MKRSRLNSLFADKELEVAEILLDLPHLISRPQKSPTVICNWGVKRRRTAIDQDDDGGDIVKVIPTEVKPPELNSPSTPLSFAVAESHKSKRSCRKYIDRTKPELLELMNELEQCKKQLTKEVNVVRAYYQKILTENSNLKAQKEAYCEKRKAQVENSKNIGLRVVGSNEAAAAIEGLKSMDPTKSLEKTDGPFKCPDLNLLPTEIDCGLMA